MAVRIDEDFRSWWNGLNDIRSKIQKGRMSVQTRENMIKRCRNIESVAEKYPYFPEAQYYMGLNKVSDKKILKNPLSILMKH